MPAAYKVLGQVNPSSASLTTLYAVPSSTSTVASSLTVCNTGSTATTYRIAVRQSGAAISTSQYIVYDASIAANDAITLTLGLSLAATDVVSVYAANANLAFSLFGSEIT